MAPGNAHEMTVKKIKGIWENYGRIIHSKRFNGMIPDVSVEIKLSSGELRFIVFEVGNLDLEKIAEYLKFHNIYQIHLWGRNGSFIGKIGREDIDDAFIKYRSNNERILEILRRQREEIISLRNMVEEYKLEKMSIGD